MDASDPHKIFKLTPYKRSYIVIPDGKFPYYVIKAEDQKEIPDILKGAYIRHRDAHTAINKFLLTEEKKEIVAAKNRKRKSLTKKREKYEEKHK